MAAKTVLSSSVRLAVMSRAVIKVYFWFEYVDFLVFD